MPTFPSAFQSVIGQVDRLYLYLDGHDHVPDPACGHPRVIPVLSRDQPDLAARGQFLPLLREDRPFLFVGLADDARYPRDLVARLRSALEARRGKAVVGYHGTNLHRPLSNCRTDTSVFHFSTKMDHDRQVDVLGTNPVMFDTSVLQFDIRSWPTNDVNDLMLAIEAARARLPMFCLARERNYIQTLGQEQRASTDPAISLEEPLRDELGHQLEKIQDMAGIPRDRGPPNEIYAMHGVVDDYAECFAHRLLLDAAKYECFLQSCETFVPLSEALHGRGKALTIDDATAASGRAAELARKHGHAVTLFINPWQVEDGRPYWWSGLNFLLDQVNRTDFSWRGRTFDLSARAGKKALRLFFKEIVRKHTDPEHNYALVEELERCLDMRCSELPEHMRTLSVGEIRGLRDQGVRLENHYWTHLDMAAHNERQQADGLAKARTWLSEKLEVRSQCFASPYGEYLPNPNVLQPEGAVCLLLHNDLPVGRLTHLSVNRAPLVI